MNKQALLRPLLLARILYERTDEDHYLTTAGLMRILEEEYGIKTHRQTIPSDIMILRKLGMDIQEVMSSQKRYNLVGRSYDLAEIKLLIDAVQSSKFITKKKSEQLVEKLSRMASRSQAEALRRNISVEDRVKYDNESILLIIDGVNQAINEGKKIAFQYFKYDVHKEKQLRNEGRPFTFSPHQLVWNGDFYYVVGVFDDGMHVGIFRLDRFAARPELLDEAADPFPADFDFNKYLQTSFRMFGTDHRTVELICTNDVVDAILDKFGKDVEIEEIGKIGTAANAADGMAAIDGVTAPDEAAADKAAADKAAAGEGHFRVKVDVAVSNVFYSWIFGFGGKVSIAAPADVKEEYKAMLIRASIDAFG